MEYIYSLYTVRDTELKIESVVSRMCENFILHNFAHTIQR